LTGHSSSGEEGWPHFAKAWWAGEGAVFPKNNLEQPNGVVRLYEVTCDVGEVRYGINIRAAALAH